jgi:hypothetical protein
MPFLVKQLTHEEEIILNFPSSADLLPISLWQSQSCMD